MDCLEAQRLMKPYLDKKLTDRELAQFIDHIEHCRDCREELEINMAVDTVMNDKDDARDAYNFTRKVDERLASSRRFLRVSRTERLARRCSIVIAEIIFILTILTSVELREFQDHTFTTLYRFIHWYKPATETETEAQTDESEEMVSEG